MALTGTTGLALNGGSIDTRGGIGTGAAGGVGGSQTITGPVKRLFNNTLRGLQSLPVKISRA